MGHVDPLLRAIEYGNTACSILFYLSDTCNGVQYDAGENGILGLRSIRSIQHLTTNCSPNTYQPCLCITIETACRDRDSGPLKFGSDFRGRAVLFHFDRS